MHGPIIECPCGVVLRGDTETEVIEDARVHAREVHDMDLSVDQAQAMVRPGTEQS